MRARESPRLTSLLGRLVPKPALVPTPLEVIIRVPPRLALYGLGEAEPMDLTDAIAAHFATRTRFGGGGYNVRACAVVGAAGATAQGRRFEGGGVGEGCTRGLGCVGVGMGVEGVGAGVGVLGVKEGRGSFFVPV